MSAHRSRPLLIDGTDIFTYDLGKTHPMGSDRIQLALGLADYFGILEGFDQEAPPPLAPGLLELVHTAEYLTAVDRNEADERYGLGTEDNPIIPGLPTGAASIVAGTVAAAQAVWSGRAARAVHLAGGLHHAFADAMSGFCMFNDAAIALQWLLDVGGAQRLVYIDFDAHHGDGVERIFWNDPRVLTISVHESGLYLFPGTGFAHDIGGPQAAGTAVNLALPRDADDHVWLHTIHATIPPLLQKFKPQLILSQHGADPHRADPLADLQVSVDAMAVAYRSLRTWAERYTNGRWVAIGGGGYNRDSVARTWTQLLATVADADLAAATAMPRDWEAGTSLTLGDDSVDPSILNFDPQRVLAERPHPALSKTTQAVFPYWGLPPYALV